VEEKSLAEVEEDRLKACLNRILNYAEGEGWKGFDPYDGLLSPLSRLPIPIYKLLFQQVVKRSPLWIRKMLFISKDHNPKGLALFLWTYSLIGEEHKAQRVLRILLDRKSDLPNDHLAFGYNFDWQSSVFYAPAYTPNIIATSFSIFALKEANERLGWNFNLRRFRWAYENVFHRFRDENGRLWFSYTPDDRRRIFNSSILGAVAYVHTGGDLEILRDVVGTLVFYQREDGSWPYGLGHWRMNYIDNVHTAYNLWGLVWARNILKDVTLDGVIKRGVGFYLKNLFDREGLPIGRIGRRGWETHDLAASVLTLLMFSKWEKAKDLLNLACKNLVGSLGEVFNSPTDGRVFMRWSQAWLSLALAWAVSKSKRSLSSHHL